MSINKNIQRLSCLLAILAMAIPSFAKEENNDDIIKGMSATITTLTSQIEGLNKQLKEARDSIYRLEAELSKTKTDLTLARTENVTLKEDMERGGNLTQTVQQQEDLINKQKLELDDYKATFIEIASNFLYLPYDEYSIYEVAIPAFEKAKGSSYYKDYSIRLEMLKRYKDDITVLIRFLNDAIKDMPTTGSLSKWSKTYKDIFNDKVRTVSNYRKYGDDWPETFLGKYLVNIANQLNNISGNDAAVRIKKNLTKYKNELTALINPEAIQQEEIPVEQQAYPHQTAPQRPQYQPVPSYPHQILRHQNNKQPNQGDPVQQFIPQSEPSPLPATEDESTETCDLL